MENSSSSNIRPGTVVGTAVNQPETSQDQVAQVVPSPTQPPAPAPPTRIPSVASQMAFRNTTNLRSTSFTTTSSLPYVMASTSHLVLQVQGVPPPRQQPRPQQSSRSCRCSRCIRQNSLLSNPTRPINPPSMGYNYAYLEELQPFLNEMPRSYRRLHGFDELENLSDGQEVEIGDTEEADFDNQYVQGLLDYQRDEIMRLREEIAEKNETFHHLQDVIDQERATCDRLSRNCKLLENKLREKLQFLKEMNAQMEIGMAKMRAREAARISAAGVADTQNQPTGDQLKLDEKKVSAKVKALPKPEEVKSKKSARKAPKILNIPSVVGSGDESDSGESVSPKSTTTGDYSAYSLSEDEVEEADKLPEKPSESSLALKASLKAVLLNDMEVDKPTGERSGSPAVTMKRKRKQEDVSEDIDRAEGEDKDPKPSTSNFGKDVRKMMTNLRNQIDKYGARRGESQKHLKKEPSTEADEGMDTKCGVCRKPLKNADLVRNLSDAHFNGRNEEMGGQEGGAETGGAEIQPKNSA